MNPKSIDVCVRRIPACSTAEWFEVLIPLGKIAISEAGKGSTPEARQQEIAYTAQKMWQAFWRNLTDAPQIQVRDVA